jgi:HEAT repeat protein
VAARVLAARRASSALVELLDSGSATTDAWLQEELLAAAGRLAVVSGKVDPRVLKMLDDPVPSRRAAAAYVVGRRGDLSVRGPLRRLLADPAASVRERATQGLAGKVALESLRDASALDEALVRQNQIEPVEPALLDFLRRRTLDEHDQKRLHVLIRELGSPLYPERDRAARLLIAEGTSALAFLRPAEHDPDIEIARRAQHCVELIRRGPGSALSSAVVRLLARAQPDLHTSDEAVRVLLGYVPFADDDQVEDSVLTSLTVLSLREPRLEPCLAEAFASPLPARRGAAAFVLGHVGAAEHHAGLRRLLDDPVPAVRLRAAQGLLAARDVAAVPQLIALLDELPLAARWRAEDLLCRLAGTDAPAESAGRHKPSAGWDEWWQARGPGVDLGRLAEHSPYLGLVAIAEYDSALGQPGGRIWEGGREGKTRWQFKGALGAMDAHVLPNGRVLVAENSGLRVTERDLEGKVVWEQRVQGNPICCQRLPNGNTFIAMYNQVLEVKPNHEEVYRYTPGPQFYIFSAHRNRKGTIVAMTAQGDVIELDAATGKQLRPPLKVGANGNWCGIETLANGNYLVALLSSNDVREITPDGKIVWQAHYRGAFRATRLPNGNTLVASMIDRKVAELDRSGTPRWERSCEGRPWSVHWR